MKYSLLLPRPKAWGQVITLFLGWLPTTMIVSWVTTPVYDHRGQLISEDAGGAAMVVLTPLTIYFLSLSYQIVWTNDRLRWFPSLRAWVEGFWSFSITIITVIVSYGISYFLYRNLDYSHKDEDMASVALFLVIIELAYLFYIRWLFYRLFSKFYSLGYSFFQKLTKKKAVESKPKINIDPIEAELNQLRADMGLKEMKDVKNRNINRS